MHHVVEGPAARAQQRIDIGEGAVELAHHVARMHDLSRGVDAGGPGNEELGAVGVGDAGAAFEGDVIVLGQAQPIEIVEIGNLGARQIQARIRVHGDQVVTVRAGTLDPGAGDEMGLARQTVLGEQLPPAVDHVLVEHVHILDVEPGPNAVLAQGGVLARQGVDQIAEDGARLHGGRGGCVAGAGTQPRAPEMPQPVPLDQQMPARQAPLHHRRAAGHVVGEQGDLRPGQWRLLHDRQRHRACVIGERTGGDRVGLVLGVGEKDAAEHAGLGAEAERDAGGGVALLERADLFAERQPRRRLDGQVMLAAASRALETPRRNTFDDGHEMASPVAGQRMGQAGAACR